MSSAGLLPRSHAIQLRKSRKPIDKKSAAQPVMGAGVLNRGSSDQSARFSSVIVCRLATKRILRRLNLLAKPADEAFTCAISSRI